MENHNKIFNTPEKQMSDEIVNRPAVDNFIRWTTAKKIGFRFCFLFFSLIILLQNNGAFPFWDVLMKYPEAAFSKLIVWVGKNILSISHTIDTGPNGSGDTTYSWLIMLFITSVSILGTLVWTILDRRKPHYKSLYYYLTLAIRLYVGLMLINYGLYKVFKLQFPAPYISRLIQPYGESSPMGLAWTFLGFSKGYNMFMGIAEIAAGLLLFRRTMTLGAIITLMTTANVMAVNYFYDVPVKILSTTLVLMTLFLLCFNAQELIQFFFSKTPTQLSIIPQPQNIKPVIRKIAYGLKYFVVGFVVLYGGYQCFIQEKKFGDNAIKFKYEGLYEVKKFIVNNDTLAPLLTDSTQWKKIFIPNDRGIRIKTMNDKTIRLNGPIDTVNTKFWMDYQGDSTRNGMITIKKLEGEEYFFTMRQKSDSIQAYTKKVNIKEAFLLNSRGFHWVNEFPFNR